MVITPPYLIFIGWVVFEKWETILKLELNSVGDAMAGEFGPIAFLWLILGYVQQQQALKIQAQELKNSIEQQKELVGVNKDMIELDHKIQRDQLKSNFVLEVSARDYQTSH